MLRATLLFAALLLCSFTLVASEANENQESDEFQWQIALEVGFAAGASPLVGAKESSLDDHLNINLLVDLSYKRFFIQTNKNGYSGIDPKLEMGLHLLEKGNWQLDLIHTNYVVGFTENYAGIVYSEEGIDELKGIKSRNPDSSTGFRFMFTENDTQLWFDVVTDVADSYHGGWIFDAYYNKRQQYRNWDLYFGSGFTFYSRDVNNYYYGIDIDEATNYRPEYQAGAGYRVIFDAYAQLPLSESWLFNSGISFNYYSSAIANSPIIRQQHQLQGMMSFRYVF